MSEKWDVGDVSVSSNEVLWKIPKFSKLPQIRETNIVSPSFRFVNREWSLYIHPNGQEFFSSLDWFGIYAMDYTRPRRPEVNVELGITNERKENIVSARADHFGNGTYHCMKLIRRTDFDSLKKQIMPKGNLHIFFRVTENEKSTLYAVNKTENNQLPAYIRESSSQVKKTSGKSDLKPKHDDTSKDKSVQTEEGMGVWRLKQDLEKLLLDESVTDVILKVQGEEFRAHRCILAARSPVFLAMMSHDTKEKNTGIVDILDGDRTIISDFLRYLYTGNIEDLTSEKALKLYSVADKYQVNELKQYCVDHLLINISVDNFCDVIFLSLQHNENDLKDACINFFLEKSMDIVVTTNWQTFLSENPTIGNELFIKHLQRMKSMQQEKVDK